MCDRGVGEFAVWNIEQLHEEGLYFIFFTYKRRGFYIAVEVKRNLQHRYTTQHRHKLGEGHKQTHLPQR